MEMLSQLRYWLWDVEPIRYYASGVIVAVAVILLPRKFIIALGNCKLAAKQVAWVINRLPRAWVEDFGPPLIFSANMIGLWRLLIFYVGYGLFYTANPTVQYIGYDLLVLGLAMDRLDGRIAQLCGQQTRFGEWWDPLLDKLTLTILVIDMGIRSGVEPWSLKLLAISVMAAGELAGILVRPPFNCWVRWRKTVRATGIGKMKFLAMAVYTLVVLPRVKGWFQTPDWGLWFYMAMNAAMAVLSVASRFNYPWNWVNRLVKVTTKPFLHIKRNEVQIVFGRLWRFFFRRKRNSNPGIPKNVSNGNAPLTR